MMASAYSAQPSALVLLKANAARAIDTPRSTIAANCSSWPGRASCAVIVQAAASAVKSSAGADDFAFGLRSGSTNSPSSPLLPRRRGGFM